MTQDRNAGRSAGARARLVAEGIAFDHPDPTLGAAVEEAKLGLVTAPAVGAQAGSTRRSSIQRVLRPLGALAAGAFELARRDIEELAESMARAFLVGRYHAWSGDAASLAGALPEAVATVERNSAAHAAALVARDLLSLAEATGDADAGLRLRRAMRGASPDQPVESWLAGEGGDDTGAETLRSFMEGESGPATAAWTRLAAGRMTGDGPPVPDPWILPLLGAGLLGAEPDAARGRLRLRLHLPAAWERWAARRIRMADAVLDVAVIRSAERAEIAVEQTDGMLPVTILLEPIVHADRVSALVDGRPAALTPRRVRRHLVVPVQLVLDQPRRLALAMNGAAPRDDEQ